MSNYEGYPQKSGGYQNRNNRYRDDHYQGRDNGGYRGRNDRDGDGYRGRNDRDGDGYRGRNDRDGGGYRGRDDRDGGGYRGRDDRDGGGYRGGGGGYRGRDDRDGGGYRGGGGGYRGRDDRDGGGYRGGGGGYRGRDDRDGGGYRGGGGGYRGRNDRDGGGYRGGGGGYRGRNNNRDKGPRFPSHPIKIENSLFLLPEHPLTQKFQRAIGMAKGTIVEVDPRKKRGWIEIDGYKYKFEDERKKNLQKKYPIQKFLDREIQFAFWPTYSQKAAKYRKIDESPTIKIANLRQTLPEANHVEIIGQVLMVEESLFVMSIFSASQRKKYMVTIMGAYTGKSGDFIQMLGFLKDGGIHYKDHNVVLDSATAAQNP